MAALITGANPAPILEGHGLPRGTAADRLSSVRSSNEPTAADWASIWGPAALDVNFDKDRNRRTSRMHLSQIPKELQGRQIYIEDRIDGLISSSTGSPFTSLILPYMHFDRPDNKISWRVMGYDEGLASRVPYESAARTLTQSREEFSAYATRHGLAITMEHNFMMSEEGRKDFYYQVQQVVGSIQKTNDLHVHMALLRAGSYFRKVLLLLIHLIHPHHAILVVVVPLFFFYLGVGRDIPRRARVGRVVVVVHGVPFRAACMDVRLPLGDIIDHLCDPRHAHEP